MAQEPKLSTFRNRMSHWRMDGAVYFVTWRLYPTQAKLADAERSLFARAITHFNGDRYKLYAFVVMDDHVHVLVQPFESHSLSSILHTWKSFTANQLQRKHKRSGTVWQKDTFERYVRNSDDFLTQAEYVLNNPRKRWPNVVEYEWVEWFEDAWQ